MQWWGGGGASLGLVGRGRSEHLCPQLLSSNTVNDLMLLESLLDNLLARQKDTCARVRRLVLRGLANVASGSPDKVRGWPALWGPVPGRETAELQPVRRPRWARGRRWAWARRWHREGGALGRSTA